MEKEKSPLSKIDEKLLAKAQVEFCEKFNFTLRRFQSDLNNLFYETCNGEPKGSIEVVNWVRNIICMNIAFTSETSKIKLDIANYAEPDKLPEYINKQLLNNAVDNFLKPYFCCMRFDQKA